MIWLDPQSPIFQSGIAPFFLSFIVVGVICLLIGNENGSLFAISGTALVMIVAYWIIFSVPPFPPRASTQKLGYLIAIASLISLFTTGPGKVERFWQYISGIVLVAGLIWLGESKLKQGHIFSVLFVISVGIIAIWLFIYSRRKSLEFCVSLFVTAFTLAGIAFLAPSASITQLSIAVAAILGGFLIWNWPKQRVQFSGTGIFLFGSTLIWIAGQMSLYTRASDLALLAVLLILLVPVIQTRLVGSRLSENTVFAPVVTGIISTIVGCSAIFIASFQSTS